MEKEAQTKYSAEFRQFYSVMRKYIPRIKSGYDYYLWFDKFLKFFSGTFISGKTPEKKFLLIVKYTPYPRFFDGERAPHWWWGSFKLKTYMRNRNWRTVDKKKLHAFLNAVLDNFVKSLPSSF